ncbi:hypothetical protein TRFO_34969 [Tritrichomonas foetus]|uniref:C2 domain-containing protein n=1 Tax=Tritrichomonas foetus TaxID=1144522 RepID=A0A1J4JHK5_9EUKA|nr:hypothetical protein TRFO_34969 [Tritrichomonas foetus]|eukprot:OHS98634.1 hypothetical protein TRFO_34969 [Tritrichomonas foetus]
MTDETESILARSNELLSRVRKQIEDSPSFLSQLLHPPRSPVAVPFAPTAISLDETGHSIQSAGEIPQAAGSPIRGPANDDETQRRLRSFLAAKVSQVNSRAELSRTSMASMPTINPEDIPKEEIKPADDADEQKEDDIIIEQKPILDEPFVIVDERTSLLIPETPLLSPADVAYPIQFDDVPLLTEQNIAEDGLWVPDLPLCKPNNVKRIECRLLWQDPARERFFGPDYALKIDTPPLSQIPPPFPIEPYDHYGRGMISYAPASVWGVEDIDIRREFRIEVRYVKFLVHPLSCLEETLTTKIRQLYDAYIKDQDFSRVQYYRAKIKALRKAWKATKGTEEEKNIEIKYLKEICECREMQEMEEHNSRMIREHLQQANKELKELRSRQITVSPLNLRWRRRNFNEEETASEKAKFEKEMGKRIQEEMRLGFLEGEELDASSIKHRIMEKRDNLGLRNPGEPLWRPVIENTAEVTPAEECPPLEQLRREQIGNAKVFLKYYVNRQEQLKTNTVQLDNTFIASIEEGTKLLSNVIPHKISIEIWETGYMKGNRHIASVTLPITVGTSPEFGVYEFTSDLANNDGQLVMGTLSARCYIVPEENGQIFIRCPDIQSQKTKKRLAQDPSSFMSMARLLEWAENHDPNDPYIAAILSQVVAQRTAERVVGKFRLDSALTGTTFASLVPSGIAQKLKMDAEKMKHFAEATKKHDKKRDEKSDYLSKIKGSEFVQNVVTATDTQLSDVVREAPIPTVPAFFGWFREIVSMYRPLKPIRTPHIVTNNLNNNMYAKFQIINSIDVPERTALGTGPGTASTLIYASTQNQSTKVFCRVTFGDEQHLTQCIDGTNPQWNQPFSFRIFKDNEKVSFETIAGKEIRIDLFDEVSFTVIHDDREQQTTHELRERRILGTINIPLIVFMVREDCLQCSYPMTTPPFQLAYTKPAQSLKLGVNIFNSGVVFGDKNAITASQEEESVFLRAQQLLTLLKGKQFADSRRSVLMVAPSNGKPLVASRMIHKQAPPESIDDPLFMLRFVSMIPYVPDAQVFDGSATSVWCTCQEFLNSNFGDDEHALLLCNFYKYKGMDAYVVLGHDSFHGKVAYVGVKEATRVTLYDPITGLVWDSKDANCTMFSIGVVFNEDNVWANIQNEVRPSNIVWNLHDINKWLPFFSSNFPKTRYESPQEDVLNYKPIDDSRARQLEREIDNQIKSSVESWRSHQRTSWNPQFSEKIRSALESCERAAISDPKANFQPIIDDITLNNRNYRMTGGPFCLSIVKSNNSFSMDSDHIIKEVELRETWKTESPNADFALGVYVVPYPNEIFVVWVMIAAMEYIQEARPPL